MNTYTKNRYLEAFVKLMIFSSVLHLSVIAVYFYKTHDALPLNFFSIVGLDLLFPSLVTSSFATIYSIGTIVVLYTIVLLFFTKGGPKTR